MTNENHKKTKMHIYCDLIEKNILLFYKKNIFLLKNKKNIFNTNFMHILFTINIIKIFYC
jgi:hypothetical protein